MLNETLNPINILQKIGVEKGTQVGDFGCGRRGTFTFAAAEIVGMEGKVYAVDVLKSAIKNINDQSRLEGYEKIIITIWSNLEKYKATAIKDNSLDVGLLINVLFQTDLPEDTIKESARMVKNGGTLFISDWATDSYLGKVAAKKHTDIDYKKFKSPKEIKSIANKLGLKLIEEFKPWDSHFGLVFKK
ncbi:MAG: methyltransferase domain-containing protein [bacterium]